MNITQKGRGVATTPNTQQPNNPPFVTEPNQTRKIVLFTWGVPNEARAAQDGGDGMNLIRLKLLVLDLLFVLAVALWLPQFWLMERIVWQRRKKRAPTSQPGGSD